MGTFRPVELLELALDDEGRPMLEAFRPRRSRRLDSADYPGLLPVVPFNQIDRQALRLLRHEVRGVRRAIERRQMSLWDIG